MRLSNLIQHVLNPIAPIKLAESWDKVGLHIGDDQQIIRKAMLCIDLTEPVVAEAIAKKVNLIVAYHPPIFSPIERLANYTWKERVITTCVRKKIAVYSPHTALDAAVGGVNDWLCQGISLGKGTVSPIHLTPEAYDSQVEIVTFVPKPHADQVRQAMAEAGAGIIGDYTECAFTIPGKGMFRGGEHSSPYLGRPGELETVDELRTEMVCDTWRLPMVVEALRDAHPYEEPAFYLYKLAQAPIPLDELTGAGRMLILQRGITPKTLINRLKKHLGVKHLEVAIPKEPGSEHGLIRYIVLCAGAGGSIVTHDNAAFAHAIITGEMRHHDVLEAVQNGRVVILAGHTQTERPYLPTYRQRILDSPKHKKVEWIISEVDKAPGKVM